MATSVTYSVSGPAYTKIVSHAAQHIGAVHGFVLARPVEESVVEILDALPVAHSSLTCGTSPLTEMALRLASSHAELVGLQIVGVYYAPEVADDADIPVLPTRLADLLFEGCGHACLLVMDASRLHPELRRRQHCLKLYTREKRPSSWGKGLRDVTELVVKKETLEGVDRKLSQLDQDAKDVVDFEDHCLDPSRPWIST